MTNIKLDSQVMSNIKNENLIAMLNAVIDNELDKETSQVNTSLVEECIDAILQIEQDEDSSFRVLVPLMRSDEFLKIIMPKEKVASWKRLNVFARAAVIAAVVATGTFSVNAAVKAITNYDFIEDITTRITTIFDNDSQNEDKNVEVVTKKDNGTLLEINSETTQTTTKVDVITSKNAVYDEPKAVTTTATTQAVKQENVLVETTTQHATQQTTEKIPQETTVAKIPEKTTIPAQHIETTIPTGNDVTSDKKLNSVFVNSSKMKTAYIFDEQLSYDGLELTKIFSDGSTEPLDYNDCTFTKNLDTSKVGDYIVKLVYQNVTVQISVTVRPNEETRFSEVCSNDDYDYFKTSKGAIITKYKGNSQMLIVDTVDGNDVYSVEHDVFKDSDLISFSSNTCQRIMDSTFENCESLKYVSIPNCKYIGQKAFRHTAIEEITIPSGVTEINDYTFDGCESLTNVELKGNVITIGKCAFNECSALESITGTQNIKKVCDLAFYDDKKLELDSTLDNLNYAGEYAFAYCNRANLDIIDNMTYIGDGAFMYCYNINTVHIGGNIDVVPYQAFRGVRMTNLILDEGIVAVDNYAFMSVQITSLQLPDSLKTIGTYAFYSNKLTTVKGGDNVEKVESMAFYPSRKLTMYVLTPSAMLEYAMDNGIDYVAHNKNGDTVLPEDEL